MLTSKQNKCIDLTIKRFWNIDDRIRALKESDLFNDYEGELEDLVSTIDDLDYQDFCESNNY